MPHVGVAVASDAHGRQRPWIPAGRLAEQELHGQAEDRGVRTNPEREREDPGRRESGISPEGARRIRQVGERLLQPSELPGRPCLFLDAQGGTELGTGPGQRVRTCHPVLLQLLRPHLDMEGDFLVELTVEGRGAAEVDQASPDRHQPVCRLAAHAVRMTRWMAITNFSNCFVSRSSCLRPSAVSL